MKIGRVIQKYLMLIGKVKYNTVESRQLVPWRRTDSPFPLDLTTLIKVSDITGILQVDQFAFLLVGPCYWDSIKFVEVTFL